MDDGFAAKSVEFDLREPRLACGEEVWTSRGTHEDLGLGFGLGLGLGLGCVFGCVLVFVHDGLVEAVPIWWWTNEDHACEDHICEDHVREDHICEEYKFYYTWGVYGGPYMRIQIYMKIQTCDTVIENPRGIPTSLSSVTPSSLVYLAVSVLS